MSLLTYHSHPRIILDFCYIMCVWVHLVDVENKHLKSYMCENEV